MEADSRKELFERTPVGMAVAKMAVPTVISQLINLIYNVVDTLFIGWTGDPLKVAAVTVAFTLFMMTVAISNLFGIGGGSLAARLLGQGRGEDARRVTAFSFYGALAAALLYALLIGAFLDPLLRLLVPGASATTLGYARQYVWLVVILGSVPVILSGTGAHLLRNAGFSRQASIGLSCGGILNILLDYVIMFVLLPPGWEVFGAALATLISNIVSCVYMVIVLNWASRTAAVSISPAKARQIRREDIRGVFEVGVPSAVLTGLFDVANIVLNHLMDGHGELELAAIGIVMRAERLPNAVNIGICQGMLPIVAYNFSSGNRERMQGAIRAARNAGLLISLICLALFEVFASHVAGIFLNTAVPDNALDAMRTVSLAAGFLRVRCLASPVQFLNYHTSYCLQAMGDGRDTLIHAAVRQLVFYIPFMILLDWLFREQNGVVWALAAGELCGAVFALILLRRWLRRLEREK